MGISMENMIIKITLDYGAEITLGFKVEELSVVDFQKICLYILGTCSKYYFHENACIVPEKISYMKWMK